MSVGGGFDGVLLLAEDVDPLLGAGLRLGLVAGVRGVDERRCRDRHGDETDGDGGALHGRGQDRRFGREPPERRQGRRDPRREDLERSAGEEHRPGKRGDGDGDGLHRAGQHREPGREAADELDERLDHRQQAGADLDSDRGEVVLHHLELERQALRLFVERGLSGALPFGLVGDAGARALEVLAVVGQERERASEAAHLGEQRRQRFDVVEAGLGEAVHGALEPERAEGGNAGVVADLLERCRHGVGRLHEGEQDPVERRARLGRGHARQRHRSEACRRLLERDVRCVSGADPVADAGRELLEVDDAEVDGLEQRVADVGRVGGFAAVRVEDRGDRLRRRRRRREPRGRRRRRCVEDLEAVGALEP